MREIFKYGSVGRAPGNRCLYPELRRLNAGRIEHHCGLYFQRLSGRPCLSIRRWLVLCWTNETASRETRRKVKWVRRHGLKRRDGRRIKI